MTTYGTMPASSPPPETSTNSAGSKRGIRTGLAKRRPRKLMFSCGSFRLPSGFSETLTGIETNVSYFRVNYSIIVLLIIFISLLRYPMSVLVFMMLTKVWVSLYFRREESLVVCGRTINDRTVLRVLLGLTFTALQFIPAKKSLVVAELIGIAVMATHATARMTEDLFLDEEMLVVANGPSDHRSSP